VDSFWTEFIPSKQQHLPSNQYCPLQNSFLGITYREPLNCAAIQNILGSALFETWQVHPVILLELW